MMRQHESILNWDLEAEKETTMSSVEQLKLLWSRTGLFQSNVDQSTSSLFSSLLEGAMNSHSSVVWEQKLAT
jgi:hypothetical protein